jgi:hypothetical protein
VKTTLLKIAAAAAGITFALCIVAGCIFWYATRPNPKQPPKPWNTAALTVSESPALLSYGSERHIFLRYNVRNHTDNDYSIDKTQRLRVMGKYPDGSLTNPLEDAFVATELPVFIPAQHTGMITLEIKEAVTRGTKLSDDDYHEQLRARLNEYPFDGFAVFDEENRYKIDLPKWRSVRPKPETEAPKPEPAPKP